MYNKLQQCVIFILSFSLLSNVSANPNTVNKFMSKVKRYLRLQMEKDETPGVVMLLSSPEIGTKTLSLGYAVLPPAAVKMTDKNLFRVASISKTFLAVMILKMVEQRKINLSAPIARYLPPNIDLDLIPNVDQITVRNLLNMTSGIPEYYDLDVDVYLAKNPFKIWRPLDALNFSIDLKPKFKPNQGYEYSNTNYVLLQMILNNVTHKNLNENLQQLICKPLGLTETFGDDFKMSPYTLDTKGYDTKQNKIDVSEKDDGFGIGDTFVVTNAYDLNKFLSALFVKKTLLPGNLLQKMLVINRHGRYGMGVEISYVARWGKIYSHNGLVNGFQTNYFYIPNEQLTIIILTNNRATNLIEPVFVRVLHYYNDLLNS